MSTPPAETRSDRSGRPSLSQADEMKWAKRFSYTGVFLTMLTLSLPLYWGNLSVYTESYLRRRFGPDPQITTPWVISLFNAGWGISTMFSGYIAQFIGRKWTMVVGCVLVDAGLFFSVLSVQHSVVGLDFSLGLAGGLGMGLLLTTGLQHALSFPSNYPGMVTAIVTSARFLGGACFNEVITLYINPTNLSPDLFTGRQEYFTQTKLLDRVPAIFVVLGVVYLCTQALGIILMRPEVEEQGDIFVHEENISGAESGEDKPQEVGSELASSKNSTEPKEKDEASLTRNVSPSQMLTTRTFYVLWFIIGCAEYCNIVVGNYFKIYGQTWIPDDQFLANTATALVVVALVTHPLWGGFIDLCGIKFAVMALSCVVCVFSNFWYFTPMAGRWLYCVWTVAYGCVASGFYLFCPVGTLKLFGVKHFSKNFGFANSPCILVDFVSPPIIQALVSAYGWFYMFISVGCVNALGMVLATMWLPRK